MPKRNYGFEKRQKELKRQQKREEKLQRRLDRADSPPDEEKHAPEGPSVTEA